MSDKMREALANLLKLAERYEVKIDGEWGCCRDIEQIEADCDLPDEIVAARAALADQPAQGDQFAHPRNMVTAPPAPSVPDAMASSPHHGEYSSGYVNGWNAGRGAMLAAAPARKS